MIVDFLTNQIVISVFLSTAFCQVWKTIDNTFRKNKFDWHYLVITGGMPSSHATFTCALAISIGLIEGFTSSIFLLATGLAMIVVRDAFGVRRTVDQLNKAVNEIIREKKLGVKQILRITGHTPVQAVVGMIIGIVIPLLLNLIVY